MNRHTALAATSGLLALGIAVLASPAASAYPVRDFSPPCPGSSTRVDVDLLGARYGRYLTAADLRTSDVNGNGTLCVIPFAGTTSPMNQPLTFVDDN